MIVRTAAAAAALALALTGCSGDEESPPGTLPSLTSSATPSATVPPMPAAAEGDTPEAAAEFAKYYLQVVDAAYAAADASPVKALSGPECSGCQALVDSIETMAGEGNRYDGGAYTVLNAVATAATSSEYLVLIDYTRPEGRIVDAASGAVVTTDAAVGQTQMQLRVLREGQSWRTLGLRTD